MKIQRIIDGVDRISTYAEPLLNQDPYIAAAVMFGRGKFQPGVLIDPKPEYKFDPNDIAKLEAFRNAVWYGFELSLSYV